MKAPPAFQFYPGDYLSSARVQAMSLEAEGAYIRLLCYNWTNGFIPDSPLLLARLCKISERKMKTLWLEVSPCFDVVIEPGKLANKRLEETRNEQLAYRAKQAEHGKRGSDGRWGSPSVTLQGDGKGLDGSSPSPLPSPSPPLPKKTNTGEKKGTSPTAQRHDPAADLFAESYQKHIGNPYGWLSGDFPQLARLRKRLGIGTLETPPEWENGILNYFASPFAEFSLQHFASKFDTFKLSPLDRFKTPTNHVNGGNNGKSKADITRESCETVLRAIADSEDRRGL